jgi:hypothetical protein
LSGQGVIFEDACNPAGEIMFAKVSINHLRRRDCYDGGELL